MWTRKAVFYVGFGTILVLFAPFINNLQLFLLGTTVLGFVAIHSLVNTRPIEIKITRDFDDDQVFENSAKTNVKDGLTCPHLIPRLRPGLELSSIIQK